MAVLLPDELTVDPNDTCTACPDKHRCKSIRWKERPCEMPRPAAPVSPEPAPWQRARVKETDPGLFHAHEAWCESRVGLIFRPDRCTCGLIPARVPSGTPVTPASEPELPQRPVDSPRHRYFADRLKQLGMLDSDSDYNGMIGHAVLRLSEVHAREGHSGMSHSIVLQVWNQLHEEYANGGAVPDPRNTVAAQQGLREQAAARNPTDGVHQALREGWPEAAEIARRSLEAESPLHAFQSGAKSSEHLLRYDLIPWHVFADRLGKRYTGGAVKYGEYNWQMGLQERAYVLDRCNHFLRHAHRLVETIRAQMQSDGDVLKLNHAAAQKRQDYDDDAAAAMWGLIFIMAAQRGSAEL